MRDHFQCGSTRRAVGAGRRRGGVQEEKAGRDKGAEGGGTQSLQGLECRAKEFGLYGLSFYIPR